MLGYISAIAIGVVLGIIGGGGSILTIPVLVYFFKVDPVLAGAYSLFVVGTSSLIGVVPKLRQKLVDVRTALIFGIPSLITVVLTRVYLLPCIPPELYTSDTLVVTRSNMMMVLFALLMMAASRSMIKNVSVNTTSGKGPGLSALVVQGAFVGVVTGFLGAGGGFLIIPALVMWSKLPIKIAVGTSLLIIAVNSGIGFFGNLSVAGGEIDWPFLLLITALAVAGILAGSYFGARMESKNLKRMFGWFILVMGIVILVTEVMKIMRATAEG